MKQYVVLSLLLTTAALWADDNPASTAVSPEPARATAPSPATLPPEPIKIGNITVQGDLPSRIYYWDWFQGNPGTNNSYPYFGNLFCLSFSQSLESMDWQLEFAVPFLLGLPTNAVALGAQGQLGLGAAYYVANNKSQYSAMIFAKQAFFRFKHNRQSLPLGRFEFLDGMEVVPQDSTLSQLKRDRVFVRLIGNFGFSDVERGLDGAQYLYNEGPNTFTFVGARPTRGVFQTDGGGELNVAEGYAAFSRQWTQGAFTSEARAMGIYYDDWRPILKTDNRPLAVREQDLDNIPIFTFGGHHLGALRTSAGTMDVLAWAAGQTGEWGRLTQRSNAYDFEMGFQPNILATVKPWIRGAYTPGSGDNNPNDHTLNFLSDSAHASLIRAVSVLQHGKQSRHHGSGYSSAWEDRYHFQPVRFAFARQSQRPLVFGWRGVPALDIRLSGPDNRRRQVAGQSLQHRFEPARELEYHHLVIHKLRPRSCGDSGNLATWA